jgi:hydrogenase large subunit
VDDTGLITGAYSSGTMFRGIEEILRGRDPRDAWAFTQRICGVCTTVHAMASIRAVENALRYPIPSNARIIRNIISGMQAVQDQVVHFYQLTSPDWMDVTSALVADPLQAANLQKCMSGWKNNSKAYFKKIQDTLKSFVAAGQLGIFGNAYWGHPAYKLPPELNLILFAHYLEALDWQRKMVKVHSVFGGRNPHPNFVIGGIPVAVSTDASGNFAPGNTSLDQDGLDLIAEIIGLMDEFVTQVHLPDLLAVARFYPKWFTRGEGLGNFLCFGDFPQDDTPSWGNKPQKLAIPSGALIWPRANGKRLSIKNFRLADQVHPVDMSNPDEIQEFVHSSWFKYSGGDKSQGLHPYLGETTPDYTGPTKPYEPHPDGCGTYLYNGNDTPYSWLKTPRWKQHAVEVGPLARISMLYATGDANTVGLVNQSLAQIDQPLSALYSTMGRLLAEGLDTKVSGDLVKKWFGQLVNNIKTGEFATHNPELFDPAKWPSEAEGVGWTEAPRGALGHWIKIKDGKIANYQTVVPTTWNAGPRDPLGQSSAYEAALQDGQHKLAVPSQPLEILRTIHSFNPCMACAVHVIDPRQRESLSIKVEE